MVATKLNKKNKNISESEVCRLVYDRLEVLETQIFNVFLEKINDKLENKELLEFKKHLHAAVIQHTDGLVSSISNKFK